MTDTVVKKKNIKDSALAHFKKKLSGDLSKIHVEEWDCDIYYKSTSTMAIEAKVLGLTQAGKTAEALVESIIWKALDEDGKRIFAAADKDELMNEADPQVLIKIASALNNTDKETVADIEKN